MRKFLDKIFFRSNNLDLISKTIKDLTNKTSAVKIFEAIDSYSSESEVRYVGGFVRKIINNEKTDDIDLATNLEPNQVCESLKKNNIDYFESGIDHGTITAIIDDKKFEITTLRKDISTDGRHAKVNFSKNWKEDASRRDFTINSIYSDKDGNLFDPYEGKKDLQNGFVNFIGNADTRIKEDYLRILRYLRFFLNYSKQPHNTNVIRSLKVNIDGVSKLSKERLLDELKKICRLYTLEKLAKDKLSLELLNIIFPELKNVKIFSKLSEDKKALLKEKDFIFFLMLMIVDKTDNVDYFLYKFNISKKNQKRIKIVDNFYKEKINFNSFRINNMNKFFYYSGKQACLDVLSYKTIFSKKIDKNLEELSKHFENIILPVMPVSADLLMKKYELKEGRELGQKLKEIEIEWVNNNFKISEKEVENIINN